MMVGELTLGNVKLGEDIFNYYIKEIRNEPIIWNTFIHNLLARDEKLADFYFEKMKQDSQVQPNFTPIISCYNIIEERLRRIDYSNWLTNWLKSIGLHMELRYLISLKD